MQFFLQIASTMTNGASPIPTAGSEWPLTGGVPSLLSFAKEKRIERIYIAGYQDGSIRIWDATYPVLSLIVVLADKVRHCFFIFSSKKGNIFIVKRLH